MKVLNPSYQLPSRFTVSRSLLGNKFDEVCEKMVAVLDNEVDYVTLTTDMWTSNSTESFIAVTAHFVTKQWKLKSMLLDCSRFVGSHTNTEIRDKILLICRKWGLQDKVHAIVTDNAANIKLAVKKLGWPHLPCLAHTLNLVVKDAIALQTEPIRVKTKAIVEYFHRSTTGADLFKSQQRSFFEQQQREEQQKKKRLAEANSTFPSSGRPFNEEDGSDDDVVEVAALVVDARHTQHDEAEAEDKDYETVQNITTYKLINDDDTRWNSTLQMYERVCKLRKPLVATLAVLKDKKMLLPSLDADDFVVLEEACKILKPFEKVTEELSSEKNVSGPKVVVLLRRLMSSLRTAIANQNLCATSHTLAQQLLDGLKERYPKVEYELLLSKPAFLDPRFKKYGLSIKEASTHCKESLLTDMAKMAREELDDRGPASVVTETDDEDSLWGQFDRQNRSHITTPMSSASIELRQYAEEMPIDRKSDPLEWWARREVVYPRLAKLARKNLSLVATSVPSERVFSAAGEVLSKKRNRLSNESVQKIVVLHGNIEYM